MVEYHLERTISTNTLDNCTTKDKAVEDLLDKLDSSSLMLGGKLLHMRCCAHILNLIVKDGLAVLGVVLRGCGIVWGFGQRLQKDMRSSKKLVA